MRWLILAAAVCLSSPASAQFKSEVDRFTGLHKAVYSSPGDQKPSVLAAIIQDGDKPPLIKIALFFYSERSRYRANSWQYLRCHNLNFLVDGEPLDTPAARHDGEVTRGGVIEQIETDLTREQMARIGNAAKVEFRVCGDEFVMRPEDLAGIRQVAEAAAAW